MVGLHPPRLERGILLLSTRYIRPHILGRLWLIWLWNIRCRARLVSFPVARQVERQEEMIPVVVAAALWGKTWAGQHICFHSDNMAVVSVFTKRSAKDEHLRSLLGCLFFYASYYKFHYSVLHIPGMYNMAADALSHTIITDFSSFLPQIPPYGIPRVT